MQFYISPDMIEIIRPFQIAMCIYLYIVPYKYTCMCYKKTYLYKSYFTKNYLFEHSKHLVKVSCKIKNCDDIKTMALSKHFHCCPLCIIT